MPSISITLKPVSNFCNMACEYCLYHDDASSGEQKNYAIMNEETTDKIISGAFHFAHGSMVSFTFQGGEPLLAGLDFYKRFVDKIKKYNTQNSKFFLSVQTNGTLVNEEWADFFAKEKFIIGLSLDGDSDANRCRCDVKGNSEFNKIAETASLLKKKNIEFNILAVLTGYSAKNIDRIHNFFKTRGYGYIQYIPCLGKSDDKDESQHYMTVDRYKYFLIHEFKSYIKDYVKGEYMSIRQFDNWVQLYLGNEPEQCGMCGHCMHQFVVDVNGNVYPCDFYCIDELLLGNIKNDTDTFETMAFSETAVNFIRESMKPDIKCKSCRYYPICRGGGCKRIKADRDYCEAYKAFFNECLPLFSVFINE